MRDVATHELADGRLGVSELSLTLGFSESRAFVRAFKRWTGITPGEFRARRERAR